MRYALRYTVETIRELVAPSGLVSISILGSGFVGACEDYGYLVQSQVNVISGFLIACMVIGFLQGLVQKG